MKIRRSTASDRDPIVEFMKATGRFGPHEIDVVAELLDDAVASGPSGHYQSYTAEEDGQAVGWICLGPTPCTIGTFDIYWIGVSPDRQRGGIGSALLRRAETVIRDRGGRLSVIETSSRGLYASSREFYSKAGYREAARIPDFYAPGDDKVIYCRKTGINPKNKG